MQPVPSLDIIIVNWNAGDYLRDCLKSIEKADQSNFRLNRVVVVDNGSTDSSLEKSIRNLSLPLVLLPNQQNLGFAKACNQGALGSKADYLLFLNPDVKLHQNSLTKPIEYMEKEKHQHIGICGIRLVDNAGKTNISASRFPTTKIFIGKITGLSHIFPSIFPSQAMKPDELKESKIVDQIIGAFFLVRGNLFTSYNGFDERFFVYFEEVDFSLRLKKVGFSSYYLANTTTYHKEGGLSEQVKAIRLFYSLRSRFLYINKHFSVSTQILLITLSIIIEPMARVCLAIKRNSLNSIPETILGYAKLFRFFIRKTI